MAQRFRPAIIVLVSLLVGLCLSCGREAPLGEVRVTSDPGGASVRVDGVATGDSTPASLLLGVGPHRIAVDLPGFLVTPASREVVVTAGTVAVANFALAAVSYLTVTSNPAGAAILLDGAGTGYVTPRTFEVVAGHHQVELLLAGYVDPVAVHAVTVQSGATAVIEATLLVTGALAVASTPDGASILLDGLNTGRLTPWIFNLPEGDYVVSVSRANYLVQPDAITATVAAGDTATADFELIAVSNTGTLDVTSMPAGAEVWLDGAATGSFTPCTFRLLAASVEVSVALDGFHAPSPLIRDVTPGGAVDAHFVLTARKLVLFETFSGVNCQGCPAMNTMLHNLETIGGYGHDRVVSIKYSLPIGGFDPHYSANTLDNMLRVGFYHDSTAWDWACPTLFFEGDLVIEPNGYPDYARMAGLLDAALAEDPGFAVVVEVADFQAASLEVTVTVTAARAITTPQPQLHLAIVENPVHYDTPPGTYGETVFHWVMREFETLATMALPFSAGESRTYESTIPVSGNLVAANLAAIAFVQDGGTIEVLQAGAAFAGTDRPSPTTGRNRP
ncbi:MAG: PEGA domain-containing protein [Candidatus Latescibacteria bacterium]|nr:PEGA domain-containing protein [Candidatus Latescibacterota bacterium]